MSFIINISIVTPTFNRGSLLMNLYSSLLAQNNKQFQWVIIDDGSIDNTETIVNKILKNHNNSFDIVYIKKENGGKHTALNHSHPFLSGNFVYVVDSDDQLFSNSIEIIIEEIQNSSQNNLGWYAFLIGDENKVLIDSEYENNREVINYITYLNRGRKGECADVYSVDVFRSFSYPEIPKEKFVSESYLNIYASVYGKYDFKTINRVVKLVKYHEGGLTSKGRYLQLNSPLGNAELWRPVVNKPFSLRMRIKGNLLFTVYSLFGKKNFLEINRYSKNALLNFIWFPASLVVYLFWKFKYKEL